MFMFSSVINSCMLECWHMSIQMRTEVGLIDILLNR